MLTDLVATIPLPADRLMARYWPGPLTLVFAAKASVPTGLTAGSASIGARISSHETAQALVAMLGKPITCPSANPAGKQPPTRLEEARAFFGDEVDLYLDGGSLPGEPPSTIVDVRDGLRLLRAGAIDFDELCESVQQQ
jgi:L-threonylcarbamoyladenylate synthase